MATISTSLNTAFTPGAGDFIVQVTGGAVQLQRRNTSGAAWANVPSPLNYTMLGTSTASPLNDSSAWTVANPVAGAQYRAVAVTGTPVFQADQ
jgi:hypothetical protein